ncbi:hypothetical protein [Pedobacter rhodius]|uniref:Auto-transporter adhesin head GIN domain-containing protein n=1 Tax=Pedobacter rhodius TaxID=3004098 RepID=A0ABT4KYD6_9SPHI|nr:hypothetical protein [Pedobacter sp. SJ11]MCZ4223942.1 hypothetical protein [Pedobacter sp. SJ11]
MKTSNKLLIALAVSLIIIPIMVIAVTVKMNYSDAKTMAAESKSINSFGTKTEGYISIKLTQPFTALNLADAKNRVINIRLITDTQTGLKIPEEYKDLINYKIDEKGVLQISVKDITKETGPYLSLVVYAPNFSGLSFAKGERLDLAVDSKDAFTLNAYKIANIDLDSDAKFNHLTLLADSVKELYINQSSIKEFKLTLKSSTLKTELTSYNSLNVDASGKSNIFIDGGEANENKFGIDNLVVKTGGKGSLTISDISIKKSSGSLSDSTLVVMPASILKTMFNK